MLVVLAFTGCFETSDVIAIAGSGGDASSGGNDSGDSSSGGANSDSEPPCPVSTQGVVALYTFDEASGEAVVRDVVSGHDGAAQMGLVTTIAGPEGCGEALAFRDDGFYIVLPDSDDWDLTEGALDFWLRAPEPTAPMGVLSRDLNEREQAGHVSIFLNDTGRLIARMQGADEDTVGDSVHCSSQPLTPNRWTHVGFNFGEPGTELWIDGMLSTFEGSTDLDINSACGRVSSVSLAGNDLPWVLGVSAYRSSTPLQMLTLPMAGGALDHFRVSSVRRDFSPFAALTQ